MVGTLVRRMFSNGDIWVTVIAFGFMLLSLSIMRSEIRDERRRIDKKFSQVWDTLGPNERLTTRLWEMFGDEFWAREREEERKRRQARGDPPPS